MSEQHQPTVAWASAWADLQGRPSELDGSTFHIAADQDNGGPVYITTWPGRDADRMAALAAAQPRTRLTLVGGDADEIREFAHDHGLSCVAARLLLTAPTAEMNQVPALPSDAQIAEAPMETYDAVELSIFDHPTVIGRIRIGDGFAVVQVTESPDGTNREDLEDAVLAAMADDAFLHGAEYLYMIVDPTQAARYENSGWKATDHVLSFEKP